MKLNSESKLIYMQDLFTIIIMSGYDGLHCKQIPRLQFMNETSIYI